MHGIGYLKVVQRALAQVSVQAMHPGKACLMLKSAAASALLFVCQCLAPLCAFHVRARVVDMRFHRMQWRTTSAISASQLVSMHKFVQLTTSLVRSLVS